MTSEPAGWSWLVAQISEDTTTALYPSLSCPCCIHPVLHSYKMLKCFNISEFKPKFSEQNLEFGKRKNVEFGKKISQWYLTQTHIKPYFKSHLSAEGYLQKNWDILYLILKMCVWVLTDSAELLWWCSGEGSGPPCPLRALITPLMAPPSYFASQHLNVRGNTGNSIENRIKNDWWVPTTILVFEPKNQDKRQTINL